MLFYRQFSWLMTFVLDCNDRIFFYCCVLGIWSSANASEICRLLPQKVLIQLVEMLMRWHPTHTCTHTSPATTMSSAAHQWQERVWRLWTVISTQQLNSTGLWTVWIWIFCVVSFSCHFAREVTHKAGFASTCSDANNFQTIATNTVLCTATSRVICL